jgi:hypothetical protein
MNTRTNLTICALIVIVGVLMTTIDNNGSNPYSNGAGEGRPTDRFIRESKRF